MHIVREIITGLVRQFSLSEDRDSETEIVTSLRKGVEFQGVNAWLLVFAVFIASIGLNVDSTAVVIGAMLISPLMGPIMGIGLAVGTYDFHLLKRSFVNLTFMVAVSLATSTLYFKLSPISAASSELLARTTPTIWDVAIAFIGGLAGIVAGSSRHKGNAIPGVAIATALMPPLCTAGYGIASGQWEYFVGAFYLFFINAVMIGISTSLTVRLLDFHYVQQPDKRRQKSVKRIVGLVVLLTVLPSIWLGYRIVEKNLLESRLRLFMEKELNFADNQPILRRVELHPRQSAVILLVGETLPQDSIAYRLARRSLYKLDQVDLHIRQNSGSLFQDSLMLQKRQTGDLLKFKEQQILKLERQLDSLTQRLSNQELPTGLLPELKALDPRILSIGLAPMYSQSGAKTTIVPTLYIECDTLPTATVRSNLNSFVKTRLDNTQLQTVWTLRPSTSSSPQPRK